MSLGLYIAISVDAGNEAEDPAPAVANQSIDFGALTIAGDGLAVPVNTGGGATTVNKLGTGTVEDDFDVSTAGLVPSAIGGGALINGTIDLEFINAGGTDTATITIVASGLNANGRDLTQSFSVANSQEQTDLRQVTPGKAVMAGKNVLLRPGQSAFNKSAYGDYVSLVVFESHDTNDMHILEVAPSGSQPAMSNIENISLSYLDISIPYVEGISDANVAGIRLTNDITNFYVDNCDVHGNYQDVVEENGFPSNGTDIGWRGLFGTDGTTKLKGDYHITNCKLHDSWRAIQTPKNGPLADGNANILITGNEIYNVSVDAGILAGLQLDTWICFNTYHSPLNVLSTELEVASIDTGTDRITFVNPHGETGTWGVAISPSTGIVPGGTTLLREVVATIIDAVTIEWPDDITTEGTDVFVWSAPAHADMMQGIPGATTEFEFVSVDAVNDRMTHNLGFENNNRVRFSNTTTTLPGGIEFHKSYEVSPIGVGDELQFAVDITSAGSNVWAVLDLSQSLKIVGNIFASIRNDALPISPTGQGIFLEDINSNSTDGNHYEDGVMAGNIIYTGTAQGIYQYNCRRTFITNNTVVAPPSVELDNKLPKISFLKHFGGTTSNVHSFENYAANLTGAWDTTYPDDVEEANNITVDVGTLLPGSGDEYITHFDGPTFDPDTIVQVRTAFVRAAGSAGDLPGVPVTVGHSDYVDHVAQTADIPRVNTVNSFTITAQIDVAVSTVIEFGPFEITDIDMIYAHQAISPKAEPSVNGAAVWVENGNVPEVKITGTSSPTADIITDWTDMSAKDDVLVINQGEFVWVRDTSSASSETETTGDLYVGTSFDTYSMTTASSQIFIIDDVTGTPIFAFSMSRYLASAFDGNAVVMLREDNTDTTQDFKLNGSDVLVTDDVNEDTVAVWLTANGASAAFVDTWYDQSSNTNDVSQATLTNQPDFVASWTNGKPAAYFNSGGGTVERLLSASVSPGHDGLTIYAACEKDTNSVADGGVFGTQSVSLFYVGFTSDKATIQTDNGIGATESSDDDFTPHQLTWFCNTSATRDVYIRRDGADVIVDPTSNALDWRNGVQCVGSAEDSTPSTATVFNGQIGELIVFAIAHGDTDRDAVEDDIIAAFGF